MISISFLINKYPNEFKLRYDLKNFDNILEDIALRRGFLKTGGVIDLSRTQNLLLKEFRDGIIGEISLESPGELDGVFGV